MIFFTNILLEHRYAYEILFTSIPSSFLSNREDSKSHKNVILDRILLQQEILWILFSNQTILTHWSRIEYNGWWEVIRHLIPTTEGWWKCANMLCLRSSPLTHRPTCKRKRALAQTNGCCQVSLSTTYHLKQQLTLWCL